MDDATVVSDDPVAVASSFREQGCRRLHVVDLDGAFAGKPRNGDLIKRMVAAMDKVPVQVGGGIRSTDVVNVYFDAGVAAVIVGTKAIEDPDFLATLANAHPGRVLLGLDARDGKVATEGWDHTSSQTAVDLARPAADLPLAGVVYTDIERDGMLSGLNVAATRQLADAADLPVIASGGVTNLDDLQTLKTAFADAPERLLGAITGRAIYEGTLDLVAGQALLDG